MEEKRHPKFEEEQNVGEVCEPVATAVNTETRSVEGVTSEHDWIDDLDWDKFTSLGSFSEEEAIDRIDRFEERQAKGEVKWISSEEMDRQLYEEFPWLR